MNGVNHFSTSQNEAQKFTIYGELGCKFSVGKQGTYILNISSSNHDKLAAVLSNCTAVVYDGSNNQTAMYVHDNVITGTKFSSIDPSLLFTSSLDGKINVWDSRCNKAVQTFLDNSSGVPKPLTCFDFNLNEKFVCAGTEIIREDAFLLFWDRRTSDCLGGYWDSHTDDITQVQFHPTENSYLASASTDGLINVYDLRENSEDEALLNTLNVGSGISNLSWMLPDKLSCTTSLEEYQLWSINEPSPVISKTRDNLSSSFKTKVDYVVDSLQIAVPWYLATGSYDGSVQLWNLSDKDLECMGGLSNGHTDVVRSICYNQSLDVIFTGGEDGYICQWKVPRS